VGGLRRILLGVWRAVGLRGGVGVVVLFSVFLGGFVVFLLGPFTFVPRRSFWHRTAHARARGTTRCGWVTAVGDWRKDPADVAALTARLRANKTGIYVTFRARPAA